MKQTPRLRIVIADDNQDICQTLRDILTEENYDVTVFHDGYDLLSYVRENKTDVIILDLIMPGKGGFDVLTTIKNLSQKTRIIIYTAYQRFESSIYAGIADKFILKSSSPQVLLKAIADLTAN